METLLSNPDWTPTRTIIIALGFDEECSGRRGAGTIAKYLESTYGKDSMVLILDEGGMGLQLIDVSLYALPAVMEKGTSTSGMSCMCRAATRQSPFLHTGIGIISEIVTALEANPYKPKMIKGSPIHNHFVCQARYSPEAEPEITKLVQKGDLEALVDALVTIDRATNFRLQTSQSVDIISGVGGRHGVCYRSNRLLLILLQGQKINAMPEVITLE